MDPLPVQQFPYSVVAFKTALAGGIGLLVGLEREWARKEIGVRTFAITGILGMLTSLLAPEYVISGLVAILLMVAFLNVHSLLKDRSLELTTSLCLVVVFFLGVLVAGEHYFTAATAAIIVMILLAWKLELERFAGALRPEEIRSAVLLGLLSVVIYPLLPNRFVDPWQLINPQQDWITVVVIAGIGFVNYVLLRLYGSKGLLYAAVLGGLVNSTATAAELAAMFRERHQEMRRATAVLMVTNVSMVVRNAIILAIFAPAAALSSGISLGMMAVIAATLAWLRFNNHEQNAAPLKLASPISFLRVLKFSVLFLIIACVGTLAQRWLGSVGFLIVSVLGGLVSSASTTASAATLVAAGSLDPRIAGMATVLASASSALVNLPIVYQQVRSWRLTASLAAGTVLMVLCGLAAAWGTYWWLR